MAVFQYQGIYKTGGRPGQMWLTGSSLSTLCLSTWIQLSLKLTALVIFQLMNQYIPLLFKAI